VQITFSTRFFFRKSRAVPRQKQFCAKHPNCDAIPRDSKRNLTKVRHNVALEIKSRNAKKGQVAFITEWDYNVCILRESASSPRAGASVRRNYAARNQVTLIPAACVRKREMNDVRTEMCNRDKHCVLTFVTRENAQTLRNISLKRTEFHVNLYWILK